MQSDQEWVENIDKDSLLLGDVNAKGSWWDPSSTCAAGEFLDNFFNEHHLTVLNDGSPTRSSPEANGSQSAIDVSVSCPKWTVHCDWGVQPQPTTDHHTIIIKVDCDRRSWAPRRKKWALQKADWTKFQDELDRQISRLPTKATSISEEHNQLALTIIKAAKKAIPKGRRATEMPWWNEDVETSLEIRRTAWDHHQRQSTEETAKKLQQERRKTTSVTNTSIRDSWRDIASRLSATDQEKSLWKLVKKIMKKEQEFTVRSPEGGENMNSRQKARWFLKECIGKCRLLGTEKEQRNEYRKVMDHARKAVSRSRKPTFDMHLLNHVIKEMNQNRSGGPDDIQVAFLQHLSA